MTEDGRKYSYSKYTEILDNFQTALNHSRDISVTKKIYMQVK